MFASPGYIQIIVTDKILEHPMVVIKCEIEIETNVQLTIIAYAVV